MLMFSASVSNAIRHLFAKREIVRISAPFILILAFFGGQYLAGIYFSDLIAFCTKSVVSDFGTVTITNTEYPILF